PARRGAERHGAPPRHAASPPRDGDRHRRDGGASRRGPGRPRTRRGALLVASLRPDDPRSRSEWSSRLLPRIGRVPAVRRARVLPPAAARPSRPPGWVPPTFLAGRAERLFTSPAEVGRVWREGAAFWVSDDVAPPGAEGQLAP